MALFVVAIALTQAPQARADGNAIDVVISVAAHASVAETTNLIRETLDDTDISVMPSLRMVTARATATERTQLLEMSAIERIEADMMLLPALTESVQRIDGPSAWAVGQTGAGSVVAVIDTGVDASHPFLGDAIVQEACFTLRSCPEGASTAFGPGSARPCETEDCTHGTHVSGIIAGSNATMRGVAPGTKIIAIQVFSMIDNERECGGAANSPCARARTSDVLAALDYLDRSRDRFPLTAINLSLSSDDAVASCNEISLASAVSRLRNVGVASIAAAGNGGSVSGLGIPACISSAISVGASYSSSDTYWPLSNSSPELDFWAPGVGVLSAVPNGGYATASGTSAAAPHVTGAWTIAAERLGTTDVDVILEHLSQAGAPMPDNDRPNNQAVRVSVRPPIRTAASSLGDGVPIIGDFNGDRNDDVLWHSRASDIDSLWLGTAGAKNGFVGLTVRGPAFTPTVADFDGDGRDDIFWDGDGLDNTLWFGRSDGTFTETSRRTSQSFNTFIGDYNGDGRDDIYWNAAGSRDWIWYGRSDKRFDAVRASAGDDFVPFVGDFNGDGRDDIFFNRSGPNDWLWFGRADRRFTVKKVGAGGAHTPLVADFNADGRDDVLWDADGTNNWIWYGKSDGGHVSVRIPTRANGTAIVGDFDGDRHDDIFWNYSGSSDEVWFATRQMSFTSRAASMEHDVSAAPGDFNGDRRSDILWSRSVPNHVWLGTTAREFEPMNPTIH